MILLTLVVIFMGGIVCWCLTKHPKGTLAKALNAGLIIALSTSLMGILAVTALVALQPVRPAKSGTKPALASSSQGTQQSVQQPTPGQTQTDISEVDQEQIVTASLVAIGTLGGNSSWASSINNKGEVTGYSTINTGDNHAFLLSHGILKDLGTLGGPESWGNSINDLGQVVGAAKLPTENVSHGFIYTNERMYDVGSLDGDICDIRCINNKTEMTGDSEAWFHHPDGGSDLRDHAILLIGPEMLEIGLGYTNSQANSINISGEIVGDYTMRSGNNTVVSRAFVYRKGHIYDIGTLGGTISDAKCINDEGQIVGGSVLEHGAFHAFLYTKGEMTDLGVLPGWESSEAAYINSPGEIVGDGLNQFGARKALVYLNGNLFDLNVLYSSLLVHIYGAKQGFVSLNEANCVNNKGQIVGVGSYWTGTSIEQLGFLLTPK